MKPRTPTPEPRRPGAVPSRRTPQLRGAAYVEAILVVIFMTIIFVGVQYLGSYFDAKMRALGIARECAWIYSKNACVPGGLPAICSGVLPKDNEKEPNQALGDSVKTSQNKSQGLPEKREDPGPDKKKQKQEELRVGVEKEMGPMMELLVGESLTAKGSGDIVVPRMIPNAQSKITTAYWLPCNLAHKEPLSVAMNLFKSLFSGKGL
jgi:hypothetical protein